MDEFHEPGRLPRLDGVCKHASRVNSTRPDTRAHSGLDFRWPLSCGRRGLCGKRSFGCAVAGIWEGGPVGRCLQLLPVLEPYPH